MVEVEGLFLKLRGPSEESLNSILIAPTAVTPEACELPVYHPIEPSSPPETGYCAFMSCGQATPYRCSRCGDSFYCSRNHQRLHWRSIHRLQCQQRSWRLFPPPAPLPLPTTGIDIPGGDNQVKGGEAAWFIDGNGNTSSINDKQFAPKNNKRPNYDVEYGLEEHPDVNGGGIMEGHGGNLAPLSQGGGEDGDGTAGRQVSRLLPCTVVEVDDVHLRSLSWHSFDISGAGNVGAQGRMDWILVM